MIQVSLTYPGSEPGSTTVVDVWHSGPNAAVGTVLDALMQLDDAPTPVLNINIDPDAELPERMQKR